MKTKTTTKKTKPQKPKTVEVKESKIVFSQEVDPEYQEMYERWEAQHLGYSDVDLQGY